MNGKLSQFHKGKIEITLDELRNRFPDLTEQILLYQYERIISDLVYVNDEYQVNICNEGGTIHLSIKRISKEPIHDWRDLQEIKNIFLGEESEAVELYPAESRLVDTANQYHLWSFVDEKGNPIKFDFGWKARLIDNEPNQISQVKQRQRAK